MNYLSHISKELLAGKRVIVRFDLNVPLGDDGVVHEHDADRIRKAMPTLNFLKESGSLVIIIAHIGRDQKETLQPIASYMGIPLFPLIGFDTAELETNQVVMLENLRSNPGEESNDDEFARQLSTYADIYVNDGFSVSHRAHASIVGIPKYLPGYAGLQMQEEIENLSKVLDPEHPAVLVMGGAKFETKLPVIKTLLPRMDTVFIGGALANNFLKERGIDVGVSLIDGTAHLGALVTDPKIMLPYEFIKEETRIVDVVIPEELRIAIMNARTVIWNGPMGNYENGFTKGTEDMAKIIASSDAFSVIGGGDSVALIETLELEKNFGFLSTGGGAMLEYLAHAGILPGIEALKKGILN